MTSHASRQLFRSARESEIGDRSGRRRSRCRSPLPASAARARCWSPRAIGRRSRKRLYLLALAGQRARICWRCDPLSLDAGEGRGARADRAVKLVFTSDAWHDYVAIGSEQDRQPSTSVSTRSFGDCLRQPFQRHRQTRTFEATTCPAGGRGGSTGEHRLVYRVSGSGRGASARNTLRAATIIEQRSVYSTTISPVIPKAVCSVWVQRRR